MPKSFKSFREEVEQIGEGVFSKFKKARADAKFDKKNTAYKKRSNARIDRMTMIDIDMAKRAEKAKERGDKSYVDPRNKPNYKKHMDRDWDARKGRLNRGGMPRLPESVEQVDEALSHAQRIKASLRMKKMKARIKIGRDRAMRKAPNMDVVKKRAMKKARTLLLKKMTKGAGKDEMSFARRAEIEKRLSKKQAVIQRLAKKMIPDVRKADRERRANKGK